MNRKNEIDTKELKLNQLTGTSSTHRAPKDKPIYYNGINLP